MDSLVTQFNQPGFIEHDPISIPHQFSLKQDIEISGLFAAVFAWGNRKTIINKCQLLLDKMDNAPYQFILHHTQSDLKVFSDFRHRTFNVTDLLYFISFLRFHYQQNESLESAFSLHLSNNDPTIENALIGFHNYFISQEYFPERTKKHIPTPINHSACKRINLYLKWMVRNDGCGVDFGLWESIRPSQLICPLDVHVGREARVLGLLKRKQTDWKAAVELTSNLRKMDFEDPVKYDFALFGLGILHKTGYH